MKIIELLKKGCISKKKKNLKKINLKKKKKKKTNVCTNEEGTSLNKVCKCER